MRMTAAVMLRRVWRQHAGHVALAACALGLCADGQAAAHVDAQPCTLSSGGTLQVYVGSTLAEHAPERLTLLPGRALGCGHPTAFAVHTSIEAALSGFPAHRLRSPLRVHIDPTLPEGEAPVGGVEVHVTSRDLLVTTRALSMLMPEAWRHELLHTLAAAPPEVSPAGRRLWLTLEEGLVEYLAERSESVERANERATAGGLGRLFLFEGLLAEGHDPHPLASELARALRNAGAGAPADADTGAKTGTETGADAALERWLDCLSAPPRPLPAMANDLSDVLREFAGRCPSASAAALSAAFALGSHG